MSLIQQEQSLVKAADKASMSETTARRYRVLGKLPSQCAPEHSWRTREDSFDEDWPWIKGQLQVNAGLEAKTLFEALQRQFQGRYQDGQLRTLQRRIKCWRATEGPGKMAYDLLHQQHSAREADRQYLQILFMAARDSESRVDQAIGRLLDQGRPISLEAVQAVVYAAEGPTVTTDVEIDPVDPAVYDSLFETSLPVGQTEPAGVSDPADGQEVPA